MAELPPLDSRERRKRKREYIAIALLAVLFIVLTVAEFRLTKLSAMLPFVNSIFFFGLLNFNIVILIGLVWLVLRNIGKVFIERRRQVLGSRLKTKLVISFLAFSIIPTLVLFFIAALYINSSFDKWFSIKIQNTFQASLDITRTYYRNTDQNAMHFANHLATGIGKRLTAEEGFRESHSVAVSPPGWIEDYLSSQRELLALDAVELYFDPLSERVLSQRPAKQDPDAANSGDPLDNADSIQSYPRLPLDLLEKAFLGERVSIMQHIGTGDLIRCLTPVFKGNLSGGTVLSVMVVDAYIPVSLVNKVDEIASVSDDYKATNPLKYPMKTTYLIILVMITLMVLFVAMWIGLYMAREITYPIERLVKGAQAVGAGNLNVVVQASGQDEISVLINSFNKMTHDLKENQERLTQAGTDLERRRLQLEAVLGNINTGVIAINSARQITTFNQAVGGLLEVDFKTAEGHAYREVLKEKGGPLIELIDRILGQSSAIKGEIKPESVQWNVHSEKGIDKGVRTLSAVVTRLREADPQFGDQFGAVAVIDDMTHLIKGQREMAWREVARRIAHEIKNPLTPIKLSAQRLQRRLGEYGGKNGEILQECTETIIKHTDELKEMVNEFSNFARFPEVSPMPNDLNAALGEVIKLYSQAHPNTQFKAALEARLPIFEFDRDQIKRVAINLLDNAIAVKPRQIQVATHYNDQLQMAVIEVSDNGPGMGEDVKARVFEPYFSTKTGGTGLGLAIAKRIVNDHDGFIRVQSVLGEGTKFVIELPTAVRQGIPSDVQQVLIIDDEASIRQSLGAALRDEGYKITSVASGREGLELLRADGKSDVKFDVVFLDIWMPEMDGLEVLKHLKIAHPEQMVIMMSGHGNIETAVRAVKNGAFDFVEKPLSLERILVLLQNASSVQDLARENVALRKQVQKSRLLVGESASIKQIQELVKRVAPTTGSVLITGENGTGKDLVAHSVHALSSRKSQPFVEVNCAAIPEELIESELFGHEKGAFTGATQLRRGKFDLAHGGTLFLDEIGDMSLKTQAKILRILQEQKFERVGGSQTISVDVRIVAATNKDLKAEIAKNNFREDLYYRLNVIPFVVPPLRDRQGDVALLVHHFLKEFAASHARTELEFAPEAVAVLSSYTWPGNVRELRNLIERIVILTPESEEGRPISAATILNHLNDDALSQRFASTSNHPVVEDSSVLAGRNLKDARGDFEKDYIIRTLEQNDWNISRTAQILGIERSHLHRKIKSYGIETKE